MQLYLFRSCELQKLTLPEKVSGQQVLHYTSANGDIKPLARINARAEGWYLAENRHLEISGGESRSYGSFREVRLVENCLYYMRWDKTEPMVLMVEADGLDQGFYDHYRVPAGGVIDVGQADYNEISYLHPYVDEGKHLRIRYRADGTIEVTDCESGDGYQKNHAYLNRERIDERMSAKIGDVVFLFSLKIVLGRDFIAVNNPGGNVRVRLESRDFTLFQPIPAEEDQDISDRQEYFSSAPRERREFVHRVFHVEQPPEPLKEHDTPWVVMLGPSLTMAMGSIFSSVITINNILVSNGNINSALPSLVTSVVMVMGSAVWPVIGRRVQRRSQIRKAAIASDDYEDYLKRLRAAIDEATALQKVITSENNPVLNECIRMILDASGDLWARSQRHSDFLEVSIGKGDLPLDAEFAFPERSYHSEISLSAKAMYDLVAGEHLVRDVPVTIPLRGAGIVGIIGDRDKVVSFSKGLLLELTAMHSPEDLKLVFIYSEKERSIWSGVKWIPHLWNEAQTFRYLANDSDEVRILSEHLSSLRAVEQNREQNTGPYYIIFAADKMLAEQAQAMKEIYRSPGSSNMTVLALYDQREKLPKGCSYVIDLSHEEERRLHPERYQGVAATLADFNDITGRRIVCSERLEYTGNLEEIFVQMSNIRIDPARSERRLPTQLTLLEMLEIGRPEHLDLLGRWQENNAVDAISAAIGVDADGFPIPLDLHEKAHGPHGVIAGMTGSGKSEFIISYLMNLALNYSPEDVAFVLIDFKGGGMADIFKSLPHTVGLITNLDGNELKRSFLAIEHELEKRQKLFKQISEQKKISNIDIYKYQRLRREDNTLRPLPHLVIISDEFAELKQQHGDFMAQLIRIARIGRSLGVHLILATQKPDGVVDDQIKSNIRFKVCLKVQDKSDSQGMIGRPDATLITNAGRFYFQVGNDEVFACGQSPWSGAVYEPAEQGRRENCDFIEVLNEQGVVVLRQEARRSRREPGTPEKQIDAMVQFVSETAERAGLKAEHLWLDPLPGPKAERKQTTLHDTAISPFVLNPTIGLYDDLRQQKHLPLTIPFTTAGNALLYGVAGSGTLEFLNTMLVELMKHHGPDELNVYLCDYDTGALSAFENAPHTKEVACAGDISGARSLFSTLQQEIALRRELFRPFGGDFQRYIHSAGKTVPCLLLVVHGFPNLRGEDPDVVSTLTGLCREGIKYGIYAILTGTDDNSIPYGMLPLFRNRYTLAQNSNEQYTFIVGKTEGITPEHFCGRGLVRVGETVCEFQTNIVFEDQDNPYEAVRRFCQSLAQQYGTQADVEQKSEFEASLPCTLSQLPLGIYVTDRKPCLFDVTQSTASVVIYDEAHKRELAVVRDKLSQACGNPLTLAGTPEEVSHQFEALWQEMLVRRLARKEVETSGGTMPSFPPLLVQVEHPSDWLEELEDVAVRLAAMIQKLSPEDGIHMILVERIQNCGLLLQGSPLEVAAPYGQGILLSNDFLARSAFSDELVFEGDVRAPRGFVIQNGQARLTVFLDSVRGDA